MNEGQDINKTDAIRRIACCLIFLLWWCCGFTQTQTSERLLERLENRFETLDSLIFSGNGGEKPGDTLVRPDFETMKNHIIDSALLNRVDAEIEAWKSKSGLQLTGQAYYRLDHTLGLDEEDGVSPYNGKLQAELRWYIFQSSLFKNQGHVEEIRIKGKIDHIANRKEHVGELVYQQKERFRLRHDSLLSGVLQHRVQNLVLLSDVNNYLLQNENVSSDELLKILNEKAEAERLLATLAGDYPEADDLSRPAALLIEIDTADLIRHVRETQTDLRLLKLRMQLLEQQESNVSYWQHVNLAPFVRYSYYTRPNLPNSSNIDAGIVFTIPISSESASKKKTLRAERDLLAAEQQQVSLQIASRIRFLSEEVNRLNRSLLGEYRRIGELKRYLAKRLDAYGSGIGEYSWLARVKEYNIYLLCLEKLIQFQYQRDCYVTDLQGLLADISILWFCRVEPLSEISNINR